MPVPLEVEAKLAVSNERDLKSVAALRQLGPYDLRSRGTKRLFSYYFDTAGLILSRHGIALRARRQGRRWEVTLKWSGTQSGALHSRPELTAPLSQPPNFDGLVLPEPLVMQVCALVAGRPLRPILVSDVRRAEIDAHLAGGPNGDKALAEMALDRVLLRSPSDAEARDNYCEIEIEQKGGTQEDVEQLTQHLQRQFELTPSTDTKFTHGVNLLYGPQLTEHEPPLADGSVRRAAQKLVGRHLERLRFHDPGARLGEDPEALHDMRVASRRLRALLRFFAGAFPPRRTDQLRAELRWFNDLLSPVRDCDVQLETLRRYESVLPAGRRAALAPYRDYVLREREAQRHILLNALSSKRYFNLLLRLEQFAGERGAVRREAALVPAAEVGRDAMKRAFRHLLRKGEEAGATPTPEQLHAIRIRAKRLRYLLEFFRESAGKPGRRLLRDLVHLQDLLGSHNDAMVAANFLDGYVNGPGADAKPAMLMTLGGFLQEELRRARKARAKFHKTWLGFAGKSTIGDWRAVNQRLKKEAAVVATRNAPPRQATARGAR